MSATAGKEIFVFAGFSLDPRQRLLFGFEGEPIPLTARAFDTLLYLVEHPNQLIEKQTLMKAVWPSAIVEENNLNQSISIVRRALGEIPGEHRFVVTVPGRGFRFVPAVERLDALPAVPTPPTAPALPALPTPSAPGLPALRTAPPLPAAPAAPEARSASLPQLAQPSDRDKPPDWRGPSEPRRGGTRRALWLCGAAAAVAAALVAGYLLAGHFEAGVQSVRVGPLRGSGPTQPASAPASAGSAAVGAATLASAPAGAPPRLRVAILPFENLSPDPANAFFADGLHEEILTTLAQRAPSLEVISRTTMMTYRAHPQPISRIARDLHASHIIEGSVRRDAQRVRLTLELIDARTDSQVWSQSYDRTLADTLTLESQVADEVASQLSARLAAAPATPPLTTDPEAYDLYLKALIARESVMSAGPIGPILKVEDLLSRAVARDPRFARAYAQRAGIELFAFAFSFDTSERELRTIRADIATAQRLAPDDPDVLAAAGRYASLIEQDYPRSVSLLEQAKQAGLTDVMWLGGEPDTLSHMGRFDEAVRDVEQLIAIDPDNGFLRGQLNLTLLASKRAGDLVREIDRAISSLSDQPPVSADDLRQLQSARAWVVRMYTGRGSDAELDFTFPQLYDDLDFGSRVLRIEHRYRDIERLVAMHGEQLVKTPYVGEVGVYAIGARPVAEVLGWTDLLLADRAAAAKQGRAVLDFVSHARATRFNRWFLRGLEAYGYAFQRRNERAVSAARESLALAAESRDPFSRPAAASMAARVFAWCGAERDAAGLLENLAAAVPGLSPGSIIEDPIFAVPLAREPRYRALVARLGAQMRATQLP